MPPRRRSEDPFDDDGTPDVESDRERRQRTAQRAFLRAHQELRDMVAALQKENKALRRQVNDLLELGQLILHALEDAGRGEPLVDLVGKVVDVFTNSGRRRRGGG